jgi:hypothetical protein
MGAKKTLSGRKMTLNITQKGTLIEGDGLTSLAPNALYKVNSVAPTGSALPIEQETVVFMSPETGTDLILSVGDSVYPLSVSQLCKTETTITMEEGTIDVTDDCSGGYIQMILDGFVSISGTANGFLKFDEETQSVVDGVEYLMSLFVDIATDDGAGLYTYTPKDNYEIILTIDLNNNAEVGQVRNTLIVPAIFSSFGTGAGNTDAQKRDLSWTKGEGLATLYKRTLQAGDLS